MKKIQTHILDSEVVVRKKPRNLVSTDEHLFSHEYKKTFVASHIETYYDIQINFRGLVNPKQSRIFTLLEKIQKALKVTKTVKVHKTSAHSVWKYVCITDHDWKNYFHWFTEEFPRAWTFVSHLKEIIVMLPWKAKFIPYIKESLAILGITEQYYLPLFPSVRLAEVQHLTPFAPSGNVRPWQVKKSQDLVWRYYGITSARKQEHKDVDNKNQRIYISRRQAKTRNIVNEHEYIKMLTNFGYRIVYLEHVSLEYQVKLFSFAKTLISIHGAGLTNMMWMSSRSTVIEIREENDSHNNCFFSLASACNHAYYYLKAKKMYPDRSVQHNNYIVDCKALHALLVDLHT